MMTRSYNDTTGPGDREAVNAAKQQTAQGDDRGIIEGKPQWARRPIGEPSPVFSEKRRRQDLYRDRLRRFWSAAHQDSSTEDPGEQEIFLSRMVDASEDMAALVTEKEAFPLRVGMIPGSPQEVDAEIARRMPENPDVRELERFMRSSVGPTIERLEQAGEGTPETRTDIVARVLFGLRGSALAARLGCELFRYLESQVERSEGYYQTVVNLAVVVARGGPGFVAESMFLYHAALDGYRGLFEARRSADTENIRNLVSTASSNLATILARRARERGPDVRERAAPILRELRTISAVTCSVPSFGVVEPGQVVAALRLPANRPEESLAVLIDMAEMADGWGFGNIVVSEVEASGGIAAAASGSALRAVDLLYNAGISLRMVTELPAEDLLMARLLINATGLRLAVAVGDDLYGSLVNLDGIDCAVNFIGTFVDYRTSGDRGVVAQLAPLANEIAQLARWPLLQEAARLSDMSRIERAAKLLGITIDVRSTFPVFREALEYAIEALRNSFELDSVGADDVVVDTASLIGGLYNVVLTDGAARRLESLVTSILEERDTAMEKFSERYGTVSGEAGLGPAVAADVVTEAEWRSVVKRLTDPLKSVAQQIVKFGQPLDGAAEPVAEPGILVVKSWS